MLEQNENHEKRIDIKRLEADRCAAHFLKELNYVRSSSLWTLCSGSSPFRPDISVLNECVFLDHVKNDQIIAFVLLASWCSLDEVLPTLIVSWSHLANDGVFRKMTDLCWVLTRFFSRRLSRVRYAGKSYVVFSGGRKKRHNFLPQGSVERVRRFDRSLSFISTVPSLSHYEGNNRVSRSSRNFSARCRRRRNHPLEKWVHMMI